jgi:site-specific recombinase XerD
VKQALSTGDVFLSKKTNQVIIPTFRAPAASARFNTFLDTANRVIPNLSHDHVLAFCCSAYEFPGSAADLEKLMSTAISSVPCDGSQVVHWKASDEFIRRFSLDPRTQIALSRINSPGTLMFQTRDLLELLVQHYPGAQHMHRGDILNAVFMDASAWLLHHVPLACFAVHVREIQCTPLPPHVLKRATPSRSPPADVPDVRLMSDIDPAHDQALDLLLGEEQRHGRARFLNDMKDLFSKTDKGSEVRISQQRWRAALVHKVAAATELISKHGTEADSVLLMWIHHLVTNGSVRLSNPAVTTISSYFHSIGDLLSRQLACLDSSIFQLNDQGWEVFFDALSSAIETDLQRPALASFHQFCISTFGATPSPSTLFSHTLAGAQVHANLVWEHELLQCFSLVASQSNNDRVIHSTQALIALGAGFPLRISEAHGLRLEDFHETAAGLELRYHPRRHQHQGKSHAAKRLMTCKDKRWIAVIQPWLERRRAEEVGAAGYEALLFGDPHSFEKTYKFGTCARLVNRLLKQVTGDEAVSFHTLRHAWVNRQILDALSNDTEHTEIDPLHEIAVQVGHSDLKTTLECYFHRPDELLRVSLDKHWTNRAISSRTAAFWTGRSPAALRKEKQRHRTPHSAYWRAIRSTAFPRAAQEPTHLSQGTQPSGAKLDLLLIRKVLNDICGGWAGHSISARAGISDDQLAQVLRHSTQVMNTLLTLEGRARETIQTTEVSQDFGRSWLTAQLKALGIAPTHINEPSWDELAVRLQRSTAPAMVHAGVVDYWMRERQTHGIALSSGSGLHAFLGWLKEWGIQHNCLVFRVPTHTEDPKDARVRAKVALDSNEFLIELQRHFDQGVRVESVRKRSMGDRPYLMVARGPISTSAKVAPSAQLRMQRFHGLLFCMSVWMQMQGKTE